MPLILVPFLHKLKLVSALYKLDHGKLDKPEQWRTKPQFLGRK